MNAGPQPEMARLAPVIGAWRTEGEILGEDEATVVMTFAGTDTYEWLGRAFVAHRVDVKMGEDRVEALEVIGPYDPGRTAFATCAYDGGGGVEHSVATVDDDGVLSFRAGAGASRAVSRLKVEEDGQRMHGKWTRTEDDGATWRLWMRLTLTRAAPAR